MSNNLSNNLHVYKTAKGWTIRRPGAIHVIAYYSRRHDAIERARSYLTKRGGGNIRIYNIGGRIEENRVIE